MRTVEASPAHIVPLLARMPAADILLVNARSECGAVAEIAMNIGTSVYTWCGLDDGGPVTLGGVIPMGRTGYVWQVAAPALQSHKRAYIRQGRQGIADVTGLFARLIVNIRASYPAALRHVRRLGFAPVANLTLRGVAMRQCERML